MSEHTPVPWKVLEGIPPGGGISIGPDLDGIGPIAQVNFNGGEAEANAHFIVRACNAHDKLLDALQLLRQAADEGDGVQSAIANADLVIAEVEERQ